MSVCVTFGSVLLIIVDTEPTTEETVVPVKLSVAVMVVSDKIIGLLYNCERPGRSAT